MAEYYVVKKREPGDILGVIITALVIIGIIVVITIYVGLIFLGIIGIIAGAAALIYSLVIFFKSFATVRKQHTMKITNLKEFVTVWHVTTIETSKLAFRENLTVANNNSNRSRVYRATNPIKYFLLFFALFVFLCGLVFILTIGIAQYIIMALLGFALIFVFLAMIIISIEISFLVSLGFGLKYLFKNIKNYPYVKALKLTTYSYFKCLGYELGNYWIDFKDILKDTASDMLNHGKKQWSNVPSYVFYSPMKYYFVASPITLFLNIPVVAILFTIASLVLFICLFFVKLTLCVITLIMRH